MGWALELEDGDAAILARALKAYRSETTEEEGVVPGIEARIALAASRR